MKVAIVYDRVNKFGGAERVLLALRELFPKAPLYTSVYHKKKAQWAKVFKVKTSFLQHIPLASSHHEILAPLMPLAFQSFDFKKFDLVISVTSEAAKDIKTIGKTKHICYCLTPTRYLWSGYKEYFKNPFFRFVTYPIVYYLRMQDLKAAQKPDVMIGISDEVKKRIKKYYKRDAGVIYPPVSMLNSKSEIRNPKQNIKSKIRNSKHKIPDTKYYLVVSRLVPYKKVDIAIRACNKLKLPLKIIGTGSEEKRLKRIAGETVEFLGNLTDCALVEYYKGCKALIYTADEDFGISAVEAQQFGKPVIAYKKGGLLETVISERSGIFFYPQTSSALLLALRRFQKKRFVKKTILRQGMIFRKSVFKKRFLKVLNQL